MNHISNFDVMMIFRCFRL